MGNIVNQANINGQIIISIQGPPSLNVIQRKKEYEKIDKDNIKMAMRLLKKESSFSFKNMKKEFLKHKYLKNMLSKNKKYSIANYKLPPLPVSLAR